MTKFIHNKYIILLDKYKFHLGFEQDEW